MKLSPFISYKLVLFFLSLTLFIACQSESKDFANYDLLVWSAMIAYEDQEYEKALSYFEEAFELIPDENGTDILHAAAAALRIDQADKADALIRTAITKTNPNKDYLDAFHGFVRFKSNPLFEKIETDYEQLVEQFYKDLPYPKSIEDDLLELIEKDQEVRKAHDWDRMGAIDSLNITRLKEITAQCGWIKRAWLLLWHQRGNHKEDNPTWNFFRPLINKEIEAGKIRKDFWVMFEDDLSIQETKTQIYGMYQNQFPVKNVEKIDVKRKEMGLPPLWYLNKVYGHELPEGYKTTIKDLVSFREWWIKEDGVKTSTP